MSSTVRLASALQYDSAIDGQGLRMVVWTQGCPHACFKCHNEHTWDNQGGFDYELSKLFKDIDKGFYHDGLTLSGGEPFRQWQACLEIARYAHQKGLNVWAYSGYTFEQLLQMEAKALLSEVDVLVDGRFDYQLMSLNCKFRGSSNQRLIDVPKSLAAKQVVLYEV